MVQSLRRGLRETSGKRIRGVIVPGQEDQMDLKLKTISKSGIGEAIFWRPTRRTCSDCGCSG
jgi:hypothetical protein